MISIYLQLIYKNLYQKKEWLFTMGCFDLRVDEVGAALLADAEVVEGHESFADGE